MIKRYNGLLKIKLGWGCNSPAQYCSGKREVLSLTAVTKTNKHTNKNQSGPFGSKVQVGTGFTLGSLIAQ